MQFNVEWLKQWVEIDLSAEEIAADISRLLKAWENIQEQAKSANAPSIIYEEPDPLP